MGCSLRGWERDFRLPLPIARFVQRGLQRVGIRACADGFGGEAGKGVKRIAQGFALFGFYPAAWALSSLNAAAYRAASCSKAA